MSLNKSLETFQGCKAVRYQEGHCNDLEVKFLLEILKICIMQVIALSFMKKLQLLLCL